MKRWIIHATAQNLISLLPKNLSYKVYFWVQRRFGRLQKFEPMPYLEKAVKTELLRRKHKLANNSLFELGTGRTVTTLVGFWMLGYKRMVTVDLNPYLNEDLTKGYIQEMLNNKDEVTELFSPVLEKERVIEHLNILQAIIDKPLATILKALDIRYISNKDARFLSDFDDASFDLYYSDQVLEHVPPQALREIFIEGKKKLDSNGAFIHYIGTHDHFGGIDSAISKVHFLKYNELSWRIISGNRFMYHNRLRASDFDRLFDELQLRTIDRRVVVDDRSLDALNNGFKVIERFKPYSNEDLAVGSMDVVLKTK